jgi:hypothetical protein
MEREPIRLSKGYTVRIIVDSVEEGQYHVSLRSRRLLDDARRAFNIEVSKIVDSPLTNMKLRLAYGIPKEHEIEAVQLWDNGEGFELAETEVNA